MSRSSSEPVSVGRHEIAEVNLDLVTRNQSLVIIPDDPLVEETEDSEFKSERTVSESMRKNFKGFVELVSGDTFGIVGFMDD